jgi:hypothetical protein
MNIDGSEGPIDRNERSDWSNRFRDHQAAREPPDVPAWHGQFPQPNAVRRNFRTQEVI